MMNFMWENHKFACEHSIGTNNKYCNLRFRKENDLGFCDEALCPTFNRASEPKRSIFGSRILTVRSLSKNNFPIETVSHFESEETITEIIDRVLGEIRTTPKVRITVEQA